MPNFEPQHVDATAAGDVGELSRNLVGGKHREAVAREILPRLLHAASNVPAKTAVPFTFTVAVFS